MQKIAVLLTNMGGPDRLESVEPFLYNIFKDPGIIDIPVPEFLRLALVRWLSRRRAPESRAIYSRIGGKSPLLQITRKQADLLAAGLNADGTAQFQVFPAMRYWHPLIEDVWRKLDDGNFDTVFVLSMYPYYSTTTTGSHEDLIGALQRSDGADRRLLMIDRFGEHPGFIAAMARQINTFVQARQLLRDEPLHLLLSAHSIPMKRIHQGDPYNDEIVRSVELLKAELGDGYQVHLSFQSKIGPVKWLSPATPDKIDELAAQGISRLLVYPLGFVADNSETLYEIGMLYGDRAREKGIREFYRIGALNTLPAFIETLKDLVLKKLNENV